MSPEQPHSAEGPREVLERMKQNQARGEEMDIPALLQDIQLLDQTPWTDSQRQILQEKILKPFGQVSLVESVVVDGYKQATSQDDQAALIKYTRLAEVLGIDQALVTTAPAQPVKEEPAPVKEPEQPVIPVLNQPWQLEYGGETYEKNARLLGDSYDAKVYQPEDSPDVVVKEYKLRSHAVFEAERDAFLKLQGSKHIVELVAIGENPIAPYLVKRFFDGENLYRTFIEADRFPLRSGHISFDSLNKKLTEGLLK